jgi:hypothetical protein
MSKLLVFLLILFSGLAVGQPSASKKGLSVRFLAERGAAEVGKVMLVFEDAKSAPFDLPMNHLSDPQTPPGRVFKVWSSAANASVAAVKLPDAGNSFIVILIPSAKGGFDPVVIAANDPKFRPGDIYFFNHADKTVLGFVGKSKFMLAPNKGSVLRPEGPSGDGAYYDIGLGVREKEGDRPLSMARWPVQKRIRMYVFFFNNPKTQRLDFRAVDEFVEPVEEG